MKLSVCFDALKVEHTEKQLANCYILSEGQDSGRLLYISIPKEFMVPIIYYCRAFILFFRLTDVQIITEDNEPCCPELVKALSHRGLRAIMIDRIQSRFIDVYCI